MVHTLAHHLLVSTHRLHAKSKLLEKWRKEGKRASDTSRTTSVHTKPTKNLNILNNACLQQLFAGLCCDRECLRFFPRDEALALHTKFHDLLHKDETSQTT